MMSSPLSPAPPFAPPSIDAGQHYTSTTSFKSPPFHRKQNSLFCCRSTSSSSDSPSPLPPPSPFQQLFNAAAQMLDNIVNSRSKEREIEVSEKMKKKTTTEEEEINSAVDVDDWDWPRWQSHFREIDDQDRLISLLKSQINDAVDNEDYEGAAKLKVAIAAAATKDSIGDVMSYLKNAIEEERYQDAVFVRDNAAAGLVGWWAGVSDDKGDPYGCIIRISAEYGRYVARSYSPRQLASSTTGAPLFEIFVTTNRKGEYRKQAVYLKRKAVSEVLPSAFPLSPPISGSINLSSDGGKTDIFAPVMEDDKDDEDKDDPDMGDGFSGFQNIIQDMIPGVKVKVLKVTTPEKADRDLISKVVEQIIEEDDEEEDDFEVEAGGGDAEDTEDEVLGESDGEKDESELEASGTTDMEDESEIAVKVVVRGIVEKSSNTKSSRDFIRVPAKLHSKGRKSFSFSIQDDGEKLDSVSKNLVTPKKKAKSQGARGVEHAMSELINSIGRGDKIPVKVLKDIGDLISVTINQAQNRQPLSGSTTFNRIDLPAYPDPLNGLYIGSHGPYTSEVIHLRRKFGQWREDGGSDGPSDINFYEYVEAVKLTGDPYVPAGQVSFRAKIGKRYQLPHKGIIPEEFGVVARYKGQGRLAEPGYKKPRWVDGELVILDGKYIKSGPVVGFVYWAPEYQFLVFFNRLQIQD